MRQDRILALVLIIICVVVALGNWLGGGTPRPEQGGSGTGIRTRGQADVALLEVYGLISDQPTTTPFATNDTSNSNALIKAIRQARNDQVKAILLHINSPGGTPAASQAIYNELMRTREETDITIVASMGDVAASGAYYVASAAHHIVANPASVTGSIGVIVRTQNISPLLDNIGVQTDNIKSGQYKDILSPFRETTSDERQIVQGIVMDSYQQFLDAIVAARDISMEQLKPLADGRVFTGRRAKELNLVDSLGNSYDALQKTAELANIQGEPKVRNYTSGFLQQPFDLLFSSFWQQLIPGYKTIRQRIDWNKLPLLVME